MAPILVIYIAFDAVGVHSARVLELVRPTFNGSTCITNTSTGPGHCGKFGCYCIVFAPGVVAGFYIPTAYSRYVGCTYKMDVIERGLIGLYYDDSEAYELLMIRL